MPCPAPAICCRVKLSCSLCVLLLSLYVVLCAAIVGRFVLVCVPSAFLLLPWSCLALCLLQLLRLISVAGFRSAVASVCSSALLALFVLVFACFPFALLFACLLVCSFVCACCPASCSAPFSCLAVVQSQHCLRFYLLF